MNTERWSPSQSGARPVPGRSGNFGAGALEVSCGFAGAEPLRAGTARAPKSSRRTRILPLRRQQPDRQQTAGAGWFRVPEGLRRILAGGKPAQRARPPVAPPNGPCPSGASKKFLSAVSPQHFRHPSSPRAIFFDAPVGHGATRRGFRGQRPLRRTCPRLISSGVPPGREQSVPASTAYAVERSSEYSTAPLPPHALRPGTGRAPRWQRLRHPVFIASLWFNQARSTPSLRPPVQSPASPLTAALHTS